MRLRTLTTKKHRYTLAVTTASMLAVVAQGIWAVIALREISQPLILHFNRVQNITKKGTLTDVLLFIVGIGVAIVCNFFLAEEMERKGKPWWGKIIATWSALLAALLFLVIRGIIGEN